MALCHSEQSEESNHINVFQILHGVYPEPKIETIRFSQGDKCRRVQDDKLGLFTNPSEFRLRISVFYTAFCNLHSAIDLALQTPKSLLSISS